VSSSDKTANIKFGVNSNNVNATALIAPVLYPAPKVWASKVHSGKLNRTTKYKFSEQI